MAKKRKRRGIISRLFGGLTMLIEGGGLKLVVAVLVTVAVAGATFAAWKSVREHVLAAPEYWVNPEDIELTAAPKWVRTDIKAEVIRDASLDGHMNVLDDDFAQRIHQAFLLHPWIAEVKRVSKAYPALVRVEVVYREPVAMVELPGGGLLPVDRDGVHLPVGDFANVEIPTFPRIAGLETTPLSDSAGTEWGDPRVAGAARVAAQLKPNWTRFRLAHIEPIEQTDRAGATKEDGLAYALVATTGGKIVWGSPPGAEQVGEVDAEVKLRRLAETFADEAWSRTLGEGKVVDLRRREPAVMRAVSR